MSKIVVVADLKDKLRARRDLMPDDLAIRLHRALSWLDCASKYEGADIDISYIAAWVSFNSCYSKELSEIPEERVKFNSFIDQLCTCDKDEEIPQLLWMKYSQFIRMLIDNKYIFSPFWASVREENDDWKESFQRSKKAALLALKENRTSVLLSIVLDRLYVLRNQILHGGATYQSMINREQVTDGKAFLLEVMPILVNLMLENTEKDWGKIEFPVIKN